MTSSMIFLARCLVGRSCAGFDSKSRLVIMGDSVTPASQQPGGCAMLKVLLAASCLFLAAFPSAAQQVYVWRDANGVMNYSDSPPVGGAGEEVRKLRVRTFTAPEGSSSAPSLTQSSNKNGQVSTIDSGRAQDRLLSETGRDILPGGTYGGGGAGGEPRGGGASPVAGSGTEGGGRPVASGGDSPSGRTTTASSAPTAGAPISSASAPNQAVPISTAPAPDPAVPVSTAPAPDRAAPVSTGPAPDKAVPISTAPAPDQAVPVSTTPATAASSAAAALSNEASPSRSTSSSSTSSQTAGGSSDTGQATLYWDEVTKPPISKIPAAGYRIYFGTGPGTYLQPRGQGVNAGNVTSYTVQGLKSGTRYYFTVTTYIGGSESPFANEVSKVVAAP